MLAALISQRPLNTLFPHRWRCVLMLPHLRISRKSAYPSPVVASVGNRAFSQNDRNDTSHREHILYERRPDWYIRLIPLLIVLDLAMFTNFAELVINHWTEPVVASEEANDNGTESTPREPALKPAWKRWGTAGATVALASAVAALLVVVRSRVIRRIIVLPRDSATFSSASESTVNRQKKVLIQTASDWRAQSGTIVQPGSCEWGQGRDVAELFVALPHKKGRFGLTFRDAFVLGQQGSVETNRRRFEEAWLGTRSGGRWSPLLSSARETDSYYS